MFTPDQTGRHASPLLGIEKTVCGSCAVCKLHLNSSADPRLLPCLHTVCNTCLTKICTDGATRDCPICAQSFCLSDVSECAIFEDSSNNNKPLKCAGCEESEVSGWCVQCDEALCLDCMSAHRRVKVTRDHEVTPKKPPTGWIQRRRCPSHTQESLMFFCLVCEELTCKDCQLITHRGHSFVQQEEAVGSQRQQLQSLLDSIRHQKETVSNSLLLLQARLQDIADLKVAAKNMLRQVVHSVYQALVLKATQVLKEIEALYTEEGNSLLERKTSLNRLEGCQDYILAFIDKILSTEGHCFLVHKKRIETQVKKLLSQETCTPKTMMNLHVQIQNDICQHIIKLGFMRIRTTPAPFTSLRTGSTQSKSGSVESSNPNSVVAATYVHPVPASSSVDAQVQGECVVNGPALRSCASSRTVQMNQALMSLPHTSQASQPSQPNQATTPSAYHSESNLPTSTVSETDPKESSSDSTHSPGPSNLHQDSLSTTTTEKFSRQAQAGQSFTKSDSRRKHWSIGMPVTFRQLVETTCTPDNWNARPPANLTPCDTLETVTHHSHVLSGFDHTKEKESAVMVEQFKKQFKRFPCVSLVRLPISLPPCGHPLPEFHLATDISRNHILVQESQEGQIKQVWRWHEDPIPSRASSCSILQSCDSSPASDVQFCAVCQSAGAALLCAKCGCAFHSDCHIPPILTKQSEDWVCLLCHNVNETVVYGSEEMSPSSLSLPDQRKCEKLLLSLLCDENRYLLYSATKNHSKTAEFDIILGRLQGTRKPPYRTAAELVSDVWTLFDILMMNSEMKNMVFKLQESFQQQVNESFGNSLHASLLKHCSSEDPRSTSETETQREKHKNTLKRMREFFMENCVTAAKKPCTDKGKERDDCGNTTSSEH
ncbi:transcription intermediary factor 1-beta isoform X2 [Pseudorasbora parva]|uniref:transcription intermediary factor 1-beta isoform X2 n=1 Tax=Pseudorasbora parva TaxID=51549 RepID=UPI00351E8825